jgi:hypothetical protein
MAVTKGAFPSQSRNNPPVSNQRLTTCARQAKALFGAWRHLLHPLSRHVSHHRSPTQATGSTATARARCFAKSPQDAHQCVYVSRLPAEESRRLIKHPCELEAWWMC